MMFLPDCIVYDGKQGSLNHYYFVRVSGCAGKIILGVNIYSDVLSLPAAIFSPAYGS